MRLRRSFIFFNLIVATLVLGILVFIQSSQFATVLKTVAARYLPSDLGVSGDFSEISVRFYPPGFSLKNPKLWVNDRNLLGLPGGSLVQARRIDFVFRPLQIFSGNIRVRQVTIADGEMRLTNDPSRSDLKVSETVKKTPKFIKRFHWEDLVHIRADGVALENVQIHLGPAAHAPLFHGLVRSARLVRSESKEISYDLEVDLGLIQGQWLNQLMIPGTPELLRVSATVNSAGVELKRLFLDYLGLQLEATGQLRGDILNLKKSLDANFKIQGRGDLSLVAAELEKRKKIVIPRGQVTLSGQLQGDLLSPMTSLRTSGSLQLDDLKYQAWKVKTFQTQFSWVASPSGGDLSVEKGFFSSDISPRLGGDHPGDGGRVEFGPTSIDLSLRHPIDIPVRFESAHIHWLGAPGVDSIYPLNFRLSGESRISYRPSIRNKSWEIQAKLNNTVENFQLDNQQFRKNKPLSVIFQFPKINLSGQVLVDSTGIRPNHLDISLPNTVLHANGKIDFKKGYDLSAHGTIDLDDFGKISGNEIHGKGDIAVSVHGPSSDVVVDTDLHVKDGSYLKLGLGSIQGRITWEDRINRLLFSNAHLHRGETNYNVEGSIDTGPGGAIHLDVHVPRGNIQDFIQIFGVLTQNLNWFPRTLNGSFSGDLKVRGGVSFPELQISSQLEGQDWEIFGERFKSAQLIGGYDRGKYYLEDFSLVKQMGQIKGSLSYEESGKIQWALDTKNLSVLDFNRLAQSDIPLRGDIQLHSEGIGNLNRVESTTECSLTRLSIRGLPMAASQASLTTHLGVAILKGSFFGREAEFNANYDSNPKNLSRVQMALNQLDFSPLLLLLNKKNLQDPRLAASFSGGLDLSFRSGDFDKANGFIELNDFLLARSDVRFQLDHPVSVEVAEGDFDVNQLSLVGKSKKSTLDLTSKSNSLSGRVTGELDDSFLYFFIPSISQVRGASSLDFSISGTKKDPTIAGEVRLNGGELRVEALESPFENLTGSVRFSRNEVTLKGVRADLGGGRVLLTGRVLLNAQRTPDVSVKIAIQETKVKVYPFQSVKLAGQLGVSGTAAPYLIDGSLTVDSALFREKMLNQKRSSEGLKAAQYLPQSSAAGDTQTSLFNLNVDLDAPKGVLVQNDLFRDVVAKGKMTLVNTLDTPRVLGKLEIEQGKLIFKEHVFQIQSATALFDNPTVLNPSFDLVASTEASGIKIQMYVSGRKNDIKIEMTSSPSMQESEIFSLLALGMTPSETKRLSASDLGLIQQGEAASLVLNSLDFNRELEDKTGLQLKVDESVNRQQGASAFRAQNQNEAAPQITVKRRFGDRFSVSAGSTIGMGSTKSNQINLDFNVNPNLSINGIYNNYGANTSGGSGAYGATDAQAAQIQNSWGLDLKFLKRFK